MCGITGLISFNNNTVVHHVKLMTERLRHRGPDGEGFVFFSGNNFSTAGGNDTSASINNSSLPYSPENHIDSVNHSCNIGFGHRRLTVIDVHETGHQPMCDSEKRFWITYNGEIYNYKELREELKRKGYHFISESDTEVIIYAYKEWGTNCLLRFNGMWAFVIYDTQTKTLFGSRDRFGVKPFYYFHNKEYFAFASEQKALVELSFAKKEINPGAVFDFFVLGKMETEPEGFFKNIFELFPSTYFLLNAETGELKTEKYYSLNTTSDFSAYDERQFQIYSDEVREKLIQSVSLRLRSDVPVGVCLSGGIDSSVITGIIHHLLKKHVPLNIGDRLKTFTASFAEKQFDESDFAESVIQYSGAEWNRVFPDADSLIKNLDELVYSQDMPLWSTSTFAQHSVMRLAKENGIKVVLDGQGGDELFAGYRDYYPYFWKDLFSHGQYSDFLKEIKSADGNINLLARTFLKNKFIDNLPMNLRSNFYKSYNSKLNYLNRDFFYEYERGLKTESKAQSLNEALLHDFVSRRLKIFLKCEDRCSMWHSVESRVPFTDDHELVEYLFGISASYKIRNGTSKYLLRESMKNFIPDKVFQRKDKMGFNTPHNLWIRKMKDRLRPLFTEKLRDYIDIKKLNKDYDRFFSPEGNIEDKMVFRFITFAKWVEVFNL
ncbi:MAG: asparagine synthase (glutamine-hydrolyzing) [Bacteroidia bacterium]|nr:asparagine synthase (glutamine-hydrolyzing) [Bacteroidia bacterium]